MDYRKKWIEEIRPLALRLRARGVSWHGAAEILNRRGWFTGHGKRWSPQNLSCRLKNAGYGKSSNLRKKGVPVVNITTGEVYKTISEALESKGLSQSYTNSITNAIRRGNKWMGAYWDYPDDSA